MQHPTSYPSLPWDLRWQLIKRSLQARGLSFALVEKASGLSGVATAKNKRYPGAQEAIAAALGVTPPALFPERYGVEWTSVLQAEVEMALPALQGENVAALSRQASTEALLDRWQTIPVNLSSLPVTGPERLAWVKTQVKARGFVLASIAQQMGISRTAINNLAVVAYSEVQAALAQCLGVAPQAIWPERYAADGSPLATGRAAKAAPRRLVEPYALDLVEGLWLPAQALAGLPGLAQAATGVVARARQQGWALRERGGQFEVHFSSLPAETRHFLAGPQSSPHSTGDPARPRTRRRTEMIQLAYTDRPQERFQYNLQLDVLGDHARLTLVCVDSAADEIFNFQGVDLSAAELRATATALIEAARAMEA